jgi:hypothetical protein
LSAETRPPRVRRERTATDIPFAARRHVIEMKGSMQG